MTLQSTPKHLSRNPILATMLAFSITMCSVPFAYANPGDTNSVNDGKMVQGGTYYNTPDNKTTFINSGSGGLWVKSDVRGLEKDYSGNLTNNGGTLHFYAPGSVVRVDANIDVSGVMGDGAYLGNGGRVFVDSAYLYQNGNIYANGINGGLVQFNVGSLTMTPGSTVEAKGFGGAGGQFVVNASGVVDIQRTAIVDTSGKVVGSVDANLIDIEGGMVNIEGVLRANGVADGNVADTHNDASRGGVIRLVATGNATNELTECFDCAVDSVTLPNEVDPLFDGETAAALKQHNAELSQNEGDIVVEGRGLLQANGSSEQAACNNTQTEGIGADRRAGDGGSILLSAVDDVTIKGQVEANGGHGKDADSNAVGGGNGGTVFVTALDHVDVTGVVEANGGNGGSNTGDAQDQNVGTYLEAYEKAISDVAVELMGDATGKVGGAGATGGSGGVIAFGYDTMNNTGRISANGGDGGNGGNSSADIFVSATAESVGNATAKAIAIGGDGGRGGDGGLIVFSGPDNPKGGGLVQVNAGNGGQGGDADADATAFASADAVGNGTAIAIAIAGGSTGGDAGRVVAPNPGTFPTDQTYEAKGGSGVGGGDAHAKSMVGDPEEVGSAGNGHSEALAIAPNGNATAESLINSDGNGLSKTSAKAYAGDGKTADASMVAKNRGTLDATLVADSGYGGTSHASFVSGEPEGTDGDLTLDILSHAGDFGTATVDVNANSRGIVNLTSLAQAGLVGAATSNVYAQTRGNMTVDVTSETGEFGQSDTHVTAETQGNSAVNGTAIAGNYGSAIADVNANTDDGPGEHTANATAQSGDGGYSNANAKAFGVDGANANADATFGAWGEADAHVFAKSLGSRAYNLTVGNKATQSAAESGIGPGKTNPLELTDSDAVAGPDAPEPPQQDPNHGSGGDFPVPVLQAQANELISNDHNLILLSREYEGGGQANLSDRLDSAVARSLQFKEGGAEGEIANKGEANDYQNFVFHNGELVPETNLDAPTTLGGGAYDFGNGLNGLNTLTVSNHSKLNVVDEQGVGSDSSRSGGHLAILNKGDVVSNADIYTQGAESAGGITVVSREGSIQNNNEIETGIYSDVPFHGGSVIAKAGQDIVNNWTIKTDDNVQMGGSVNLFAGNNIINNEGGVISANAYWGNNPFAGSILSKAGNFNLNLFGIIEANASAYGGYYAPTKVALDVYDDNYVDQQDGYPYEYEQPGHGGYVHMHGNNVAANFGTLQANGSSVGGRVLLTAGDKDPNNNDRPGLTADFLSLLGGGPYNGFSITGLTPPLTELTTTFNPTQSELALNIGDMNAFGGYLKDGRLYIAGNNQAAMATGSSYNGVVLDTAAILSDADPNAALQNTMDDIQNNGGHLYFVAGQNIQGSDGVTRSAVETVACAAAPNNDEPDTNPEDPTHQGSEFPDDFVLPAAGGGPGGGGGTPGGGSKSSPDPDLLGLFQEQRPVTDTTLSIPARVIIGFAQPGMFLAKSFQSYAPVTEKILQLALDEYNLQLTMGLSRERALQRSVEYLEEAGVDADVAAAILEQVQQGFLVADEKILASLKALAEQQTPQVPGGGDILRQ